MAQKTDLNINPYYDDFDQNKNFYKVLFKPGYPVQARELTTLQSILQGQIESFGNNFFKEGSMVLPGDVTFDSQFSAVRLNTLNLGIDISLYIKNFVGKTITGQLSGVTATVQYVALPSDSSLVDNVTIYVKYINVGFDSQTTTFQDGESLFASENVTYGNTTIVSGTTFASLLGVNATSVGSAASIDNGVYFVRGSFVNVSRQTIILDFYTNTPSYRVGLRISEDIVNSKDDSSLFDNAKGFSNFASPGADRFKIGLTLDKKPLTDLSDTDFIEILRVENGRIKKISNKTTYNILRDYFAERTYDESGHYTIDPFTLNVEESLNDRISNDGVYLEDEITDQGNAPSENLMCFQVSPGKAYVAGYDVEFDSTQSIDVQKPRDTQSASNVGIPFEMGNLLRINNVNGFLKENETIDLRRELKGDSVGVNTIGKARVYGFNLTDSAYSGDSTQWDLYLYDVQTHTTITTNRDISVEPSFFVKGKSSGASGYVVNSSSDDNFALTQTSGTFAVGEQLIINGIDTPVSVKSISVYSSSDVKSVAQSGHVGFQTFTADSVLESKKFPNGITEVNITGSTLTSPGKLFTGFKYGDIISVIVDGDLKYDRVNTVGSDLTSLTLAGTLSTVTGVFEGGTITNGNYVAELRVPKLRDSEDSYLYAKLPESNISSIDLSDSQLLISKQITGEETNGSGELTFDTNSVSDITNVTFESFDQERYGIGYSGAGIGTITSDAFSIDSSTNTVTIRGLLPNQSTDNGGLVVNTTLKKTGIKSKIKEYTRSAVKVINLSKYPESGSVAVGNGSSSIVDGLIYNQYYGLRVQDEEISLDVPDVANILVVYESTGTGDPLLDEIQFSSISSVGTNAIIGENIVGSSSGAVARIVSNSNSSPAAESSNHLGIVYLNEETFLVGETVKFRESNIESTIQSITLGNYKNVTTNFRLNKGQKNDYYDYSRIVRVGSQTPERRLLVVYDHYTVPSSDNGDVFTVLSYDRDRYSRDIPRIGSRNIKASDVLDFRPRVQNNSSTTQSPFAFDSRTFTTNSTRFNLKSGESSVVGYDFYLPRIDNVYLDKFGNILVRRGISSKNPEPPVNQDVDLMHLAEVRLPAYLYNVDDAFVRLIDNRRYTMRDIGSIEDRIENLEKVTSLSLLELGVKSLIIEDSAGNSRFKSGIFVDDFTDNSLSDENLTKARIGNKTLRPPVFSNTLKQRPIPASQISESTLDLSENYDLLDPNVQKTGNLITLKYDSIGWIEQALATRSENVNPFGVLDRTGVVTLVPRLDNRTRTIRVPSIHGGRTNEIYGAKITSFRGNDYISSRNVSFFARGLTPFARHYQFLDNHSNVDFIPKLVEIANSATRVNYGSANNSFAEGETIHVLYNDKIIGKFRLASSNHKEGKYNSASKTYNVNPYVRQENIPSSYSQSSKTINIDLNSLSAEDQGNFYGYLKIGAKIIGQTSKAIAYVKNLRLISDNNGDLYGSFFIKDPYTNPKPNPLIRTGKKTFKLTSSVTNSSQLPGSSLISMGEAIYNAIGGTENLITKTTSVSRKSPLAQSFTVGSDIRLEDGNGKNDDDNGAFLTAVDLFFSKKPSENAPLIVQIRTMELGSPTLSMVGNSKVLLPSDINVSTTGETATRVTFDQPIFLSPGNEYALTLLSPSTDQYEVWTAKIGERTVNTQTLPDAEAVRYSKQYALGSLFKSQNGSTWTPAQESDLKFKLYKARFTANTGIAHFSNPPLDESNGYVQTLTPNSLTALPKTMRIGITTVASDDSFIGILTAGRRLFGNQNAIVNSSARIVSVGSSVSISTITSGGANYTTRNDASTTTLIGKGEGLTFNITNIDSNGAITGLTTANLGNGYAVGDVVTISSDNFTGRDARITITEIGGIDTLYLTDVQGTKSGGTPAFATGVGITYYDDNNNIIGAATTQITSITFGTGLESGNILKVEHFNHGMYANTNKLKLIGVESDVSPTKLTSNLPSTTIAGGTINVASIANLSNFEGISVGAANTGYVKIGEEIVSYTNPTGTSLEIVERGVDNTIIETHDINTPVHKYEFVGVSLRRINNVVHDIYETNIKANEYYIGIGRSFNGADRSKDTGSSTELSFTNRLTGGGSNIKASENIIFNKINPQFDVTSPGKDTITSATIRTTTATSIDGTETSFQRLNEIDSVILNQPNTLSSNRMVCSRTNEENQAVFDNVVGRRSFTTAIVLSSLNENISPFINLESSNVEFLSDIIDKPVTDFTSDSSPNSITNDPHSAVYVSKLIRLGQPASTLKVILNAYRPSSADIRVLYGLIRDDSSEVEQEFELFPGYENLETTSSGSLKVVDSSLNNGHSDFKVPVSEENQFLEYEYTANDLPDFSGYRVKIIMNGTDQANTPIIKDLRTIALK